MLGCFGLRLPRVVAEGTAPIVRAVFVAAAAAAMLHPAAALAQSSGCSAINAGLLDFNAVIVNSNASQPGTTSKFAGNTGALSMMRTTTSYTDNVAGTSNFAPDATTTYAFTTGDRLEFTANVSAINVIDSARIRFRAGLSTGNGAYIGSTGRADTTTTGTFTGYYVIPTGLRAVGMSVDSPNGNNVTASVSVICIPFAAPTPTLAVSMAHTGTPAQGGTVDYTIVPSASGAATSGTLTLAFTLPTGLSYASGTGTGWSCTSASCTYSTTIAAGASGNPLTLRANVAATAATSVTPSVSVSGGGAASAATANSPTTIAQVAASLTVTGGATQTATVGTAFATPLSVTVRDAASVVIPGTTVTFTAPGTGASGSFGNSSSAISVQSDASGVASSGTFTANTTAGSYTVSATAGSATASFTLTNGSAAVPPTVTGITPTSGTTAGGTSVVIAGTGLTGATTVHFGALRATSFTVSSATQITATTPAASAGVVDVTVTTGAGTSLTSAADQFTYVATPATPTLTSTPPSLSNSATATFQFTLGSGTAQCALDGGVFAACTSPISYSGLSDGSHTLDIRATNGGQTSASVSHQWTIDTTAPPPPVIGAPADGSNRPASLRSVSGTAAAGSTIIVYLDGTPDGTATADGSGNWTYTLATLAAGAHNVKARSSDAAGNVSADSATSTFTTVAVLTATQTVPVVTAVVNTAITPVQPVTASGGLAPIVYALTGATLPAGLTFATATGVVSGTASAPIAATSYTVTATDWLSQTASKTFTLSVSAASQTISFTSTAPSSAVIGGLPYTPSATATSGLTVSFAVDAASAGICTISGGSVSFTAAGTCRITADQAGNGSYAAAPQVQQSFTIGAASQTIGFTSTAPASAVVGGSPYTPSATATSGLTVTFAIDPASAGVCTISGGSVSFTGTGTCGITADQAGNGSYAAAPQVQQSFTIGAARQTIGFTSTAPASAKVGGESYTPAATATSGLSVRFAIDPSSAAVCVLSGGTVRFEAAGTCRITADQSGNGSYSAAPQSWQDVAVAKGDQTIDFAALANATLSASPLTLAGTATSGLPVRFTSNTPAVCTVAGTSVTLRAQGTCTLAADQDGTVDWLPAPTVTRGFTVLPVTLAITSGAAGVTQVGSPFEQANDPTGGIAPYSFTLASGAPPAGTSLDATTGAVRGTPTAAGPYSYAITVHDSASPVGTATGSVISGTVAKGAQTLGFTSTPPSPGVIGGDYTVAATSTAALAPAFAIAPASTAVCSVTGATVRFIAAGSCVILAEQPGTPNYDPAPGISQTVTIVAAPTTADRSGITVPYASSGTAIDLSGAIGGGAHTGLAIATPPAHGTTSVAGDIVTYVPAATFYGADSFTYTATGPGGTSAPATVSVTIATPAAPGVANLSAAVAFASTGTAIDLQPSGVYVSLAVATVPTKGSVSITGTTATYVPNAGSFGTDSFTYTATGPGGTSAPATVSVTIATPAAPGVANLSAAVAFASTGTAIDLQPSGVYVSLAVATVPTKGSVSITGTTATYVPNAGSFGTDSFTYTATGPGGTSAPATIGVTIDTPPAPTADPVSVDTTGTTVEGGASVGIDLSRLVSGSFSSLEIATPPAHGTVSLQSPTTAGPSPVQGGARALAAPRWTATYTPRAGFAGKDSFQFAAIGPGGRSPPATVEIVVTGQAPTAAPKSARTGDAQTVSIELTEGATGGPFTAATIDAILPVNAATAQIVQGGGAAEPTYRLDVTTTAHFDGTVVVRYRLGNAFGLSAATDVTVAIAARPDPSADPVVSAIADSQAETARRFARAQVANFMTRTQQLHHGGGATNPLGIAVTLRDAILTPGVDDAAGPGAQTLSASRSHLASATHAEAALPGRANDPVTASERLRRRGTRGDLGATDREPDQRAATQSPHDAATHGPRPIGDIALWSGGSIELGTLDRRSGRAKITLASGGLSAGADLRIADWGTLGVGGGYGSDVSRIDGEAARVRSETDVFAAYGSFAPIEGAFVDAVLGHGSLDYRTRRAVAATGAVALGTRGGTLTFGAVSAGVDQRDRAVRWSGYGRFEWLSGKLDAYAETGADRYDLRFDSRSVRSLTGVVGGRLETTQDLGFARLNPRVVAEWLHEFQGAGVQTLDYADFTGPSVYRIRNTGWQREQVQLAVGSRLTMMLDWILDAELGVRGAAGERVVNGRLTVSKKF